MEDENNSSTSSSDSEDGFSSFIHEHEETPQPVDIKSTSRPSLATLARDNSNRSSGSYGGSGRRLDPGLRLSRTEGDGMMFEGTDPSPGITPSREGVRLQENPFDDSILNNKPSPLANIDTSGADPSPSLTSATPQARSAISPFFDEVDLKRGYISAVTRTPAPTRQSSAILPANEQMSLQDLHATVALAATRAAAAVGAEAAATTQQRKTSSPNTSSDDEPPPPPPSKKSVTIEDSTIIKQGPSVKRDQTPAHSLKRLTQPLATIDLSMRRPTVGNSLAHTTLTTATSTSFDEPPDVRSLLARARQAEKKLALVLIAKSIQRRLFIAKHHAFQKWRKLCKPSPSLLDTADSAQRMALDLLQRLQVLGREDDED